MLTPAQKAAAQAVVNIYETDCMRGHTGRRLVSFAVILLSLLPLSTLPAGCGGALSLPFHRVAKPHMDAEGKLRPNYLALIEPARWPEAQTVRVYLHADAEARVLPWVLPIVREAVEFPTGVVSPHVSVRFVDGPPYDVEIKFVKIGALRDNVIGRTSPIYSASGVVSGGLIEIDAILMGNPGHLQNTVAHEWVHELGVGGHSDDPADLMYPTVPGPRPFADTMTVRDVNTLLSIYEDRWQTDRSRPFAPFTRCELRATAAEWAADRSALESAGVAPSL